LKAKEEKMKKEEKLTEREVDLALKYADDLLLDAVEWHEQKNIHKLKTIIKAIVKLSGR